MDALVTFKGMASHLAAKWSLPYSAIMGWLRCPVRFALLHPAVKCLRGLWQNTSGSLGFPGSPKENSKSGLSSFSRFYACTDASSISNHSRMDPELQWILPCVFFLLNAPPPPPPPPPIRFDFQGVLLLLSPSFDMFPGLLLQ